MKHSVCVIMLALGIAGFGLPAAGADSTLPPVRAKLGTIVGMLTNSERLPVAGATVTAARADGGSIRATISNSEGVYSFADLTPGEWVITAELDAAAGTVVASVAVTAGKATRRDVAMNTGAPTPAAPAAGFGARGRICGTRGRICGTRGRICGARGAVRDARGRIWDARRRVCGVAGARGRTGVAAGAERGRSAAGARARAGGGHANPVRERRRYRLAERHAAREVADLRHEILHPRDAPGRELSAKRQPPDRPYGRRLDRGVPLRRIPDRAGEFRRRLSLEERQGALSVDVRHVRNHHAAQRCERRGGPVGSARRLPILLGGKCRVSLRREPRPQRGCGRVRLVHRPVQLLQLRQLDLPALVRVVQHALVLQRTACPVVADPGPQDRAVADQRLAVLCEVQPPSGLRRPDPLDPERHPQTGVQHLYRRTG